MARFGKHATTAPSSKTLPGVHEQLIGASPAAATLPIMSPYARILASSLALVVGVTAALALPVAATPQPTGLDLQLIGRYSSDAFNTGGAEITAYDAGSRRLFVINAQAGTVDVLDLSDPKSPQRVLTLDTPGANSVATHGGLVAVAQEAVPRTSAGTVAFFRAASGKKLAEVAVGAVPDMVMYTPDGSKLVVANEGEPSSYCADGIDPEGSVSVIDLSRGVSKAVVHTADFHAWNGREGELRAQGVRIFGPGASAAQDLEPEYVAVDKGGDIAWVTLQENNALAKVDLNSATIVDITPLGLKDHSLAGNGFDGSDRDSAISIKPQPVLGMYLPDAIAPITTKEGTYLVTANEGDAREWSCFDEQARVASLPLDLTAFPNAAALKANGELGRLRVTSTSPRDSAGNYTQLWSFGGRSVSIWDDSGALVWDSGDQLEQLIAAELPAHFNSNHEANDFDTRSDDKGPEPEGVVVGKVRGRTYAFVGLERIGGVVTLDVTDPRQPVIAGYVNSRDFSGVQSAGTAGDLGPEGLYFISEADSPTGVALLVVGNEVSGTTAIFEIR